MNFKFLAIFLSIIIFTDIFVFLDIPILRQIFGFIFLTVLPGFLILQIMKLNKLSNLSKFILIFGLSFSFIMIYGLLINQILPMFGYNTPLSFNSIIITYNIVLIILTVYSFYFNKESVFKINLKLNDSEKCFLILPILFISMSIFGTYILNSTEENYLLILLLILIATYVIFITLMHEKIPKRIYPAIIFLISLSILLMFALRTNHIIVGSDTGRELYFFQHILNNSRWNIFTYDAINVVASISILPAIYKVFLGFNQEYTFKLLYAFLYSISPLIIFKIAKNYLKSSYAFLATFLFISQTLFLWAPANARTVTAILFCALFIMIWIDKDINDIKKRILAVIFLFSVIISHYTTAFIFFFILLGGFLINKIIIKDKFNKSEKLTVFTSSMILLFLLLIYLWYAQISQIAFDVAVTYLSTTFTSFINIFSTEVVRSADTSLIFGSGGNIFITAIVRRIEFFSLWGIILLTVFGVIMAILGYFKFSLKNIRIKSEFNSQFLSISISSLVVMMLIVLLPYISTTYDLTRTFPIILITLATFFIFGAIKLTTLLRLDKFTTSAPRLIILLILIPYFLSVSGLTYNLSGITKMPTVDVNSTSFIYDQDIYSGLFLNEYSNKNKTIYTETIGFETLYGLCGFPLNSKISYKMVPIFEKYGSGIQGYIYLRYSNVIENQIYVFNESAGKKTNVKHNLTEYTLIFEKKNKIYDNGGSIIYFNFEI